MSLSRRLRRALASAGARAFTFPVRMGVNTSQESSTTSTHTVALPASIAAGELLVVIFRTTNVTNDVSTPSGWTLLFKSTDTQSRNAVYYRIADGTEGSTLTVTTTGTNTRSGHLSMRYRDYGGPPEISSQADGNSTTPDPPSFSPSWGSAKTQWIAMNGAARETSAYPTNYTDGMKSSGGSGAEFGNVACAFRDLETATEDPDTFTITQSRAWNAFTIAIEPGSEGPAP